MKYEEIASHTKQLKDLAAKYGIREVFIFGSVAAGTASPTSDIDLLIELEPDASALGISGFQYEAQQLLGVKVDVIPTFALPQVSDKAFVKSVQSSAKRL